MAGSLRVDVAVAVHQTIIRKNQVLALLFSGSGEAFRSPAGNYPFQRVEIMPAMVRIRDTTTRGESEYYYGEQESFHSHEDRKNSAILEQIG